MDQSEIDALMNPGSGKTSKKGKAASSDAKPASSAPEEKKPAVEAAPSAPVAAPIPDPVAAPIATPVAAPVATPVAAPVATPVAAPVATPVAESAKTEKKPDQDPKLITEIGAVTSVTERETNKVMDKLDEISQLLDRQKDLVTGIMGRDEAQNPAIQNSINQIMSACSDIQNRIYEAMDLMQFQDITRQKLERIIHHLKQIHDYICDLLGTGFKQETTKVSVSRTIAQTGTTPDENKEHADSVVAEFQGVK